MAQQRRIIVNSGRTHGSRRGRLGSQSFKVENAWFMENLAFRVRAWAYGVLEVLMMKRNRIRDEAWHSWHYSTR